MVVEGCHVNVTIRLQVTSSCSCGNLVFYCFVCITSPILFVKVKWVMGWGSPVSSYGSFWEFRNRVLRKVSPFTHVTQDGRGRYVLRRFLRMEKDQDGYPDSHNCVDLPILFDSRLLSPFLSVVNPEFWVVFRHIGWFTNCLSSFSWETFPEL